MPLPTLDDQKASPAYARIKAEASATLSLVQGVKADIGTAMAVQRLADLHRRVRTFWIFLGNAKLVAGINAVAQSDLNDATYDLVANITAVQTACANVTTWLESNIPGNATGVIVTQRYVAGQIAQPVVMTAAAMTALGPLLDALVTAIQG